MTSLFANQREINLTSTVALVEQVLGELGHPPDANRAKEPGALHAWRLTKGSAVTTVAVVPRTAFPHLRITAVVMTLDAAVDERSESMGGGDPAGSAGGAGGNAPRGIDRTALFAHLLELNARLCGVAFATDGDRVLLVSERSTLDLDHSEVHDAIERVTMYADEHDDVLVARFGGRVGA